MLVLSRKESDKIIFPTVGISVEILRIRGNTTRLGIDAPPEIPVYRHEIADLKSVEFTDASAPGPQLRRVVHAVRDRLAAAAVALNQLHAHLDATGDATAQDFILEVFRNLRALEQETDEAIDSDESSVAQALLVEEDANARNLLASYLRLRGIETTVAADGQDALDFLSLHATPDVVLLNLQPPQCAGRSLVRTLRADASLRGVKLFAISSVDPMSLGVVVGPGGIDRWFPQPVDPEYLASQITGEPGGVATAA